MIIAGLYWLAILAPKSLPMIVRESLTELSLQIYNNINNDNKIYNLAYYQYILILIFNYCKKKKKKRFLLYCPKLHEARLEPGTF